MVGDRIKDTIQIYKEVSMRRWGEKSTLISESSGKASLDYLTMANGGGGLGYANVGVGFLGLLRTFLGSVVLETSAGLLGSSFRHSHGGGGNSQHGGRGGCEHGTPVHDFRVRACRAPYWCHLRKTHSRASERILYIQWRPRGEGTRSIIFTCNGI